MIHYKYCASNTVPHTVLLLEQTLEFHISSQDGTLKGEQLLHHLRAKY